MSQQLQSQPQLYGQRGQPSGDQQMPGGSRSTGGTARGSGGIQTQTYYTRNYLPENVRVEVIKVLNRTLADTVILESQAKFAHWNVKGQDFYGLHELFDDIAEMFEEQADRIGERITALGGQALGTAGLAVANRGVPAMPHDIVHGMAFVDVLADQLAVHDAGLHEAIQVAQGYDDIDSVDLLNDVSLEVSEKLWFLEAHLQTQPVSTIPVSGGRQGGGQQSGRQQGGGQGIQSGVQGSPPGQQGQTSSRPGVSEQGQYGPQGPGQ